MLHISNLQTSKLDISQLVYMQHVPLSMFYRRIIHAADPSLSIYTRAGVVLECFYFSSWRASVATSLGFDFGLYIRNAQPQIYIIWGGGAERHFFPGKNGFVGVLKDFTE